MSNVAHLKVRLADVPGIESLSMALQAGRVLLQWGTGHTATVDAAASNGDIDAAIRNAIKLPALSLIPDTNPAPAPMPANPVKATPMSANPSQAVSKIEDMMTRHMAKMEDIHNAQLAILQSTLDKQADTVTRGVSAVAEKIAAQTDDFNAMMGRFTNSVG